MSRPRLTSTTTVRDGVAYALTLPDGTSIPVSAVEEMVALMVLAAPYQMGDEIKPDFWHIAERARHVLENVGSSNE